MTLYKMEVKMLINNKILVELFASDSIKNSYEKNKKVTGSMKNQLLNIAKNQYKIVEDLGRGKYNIDEKFDGSVMIPNNKLAHPIYGKLIPAILLNVKNFHDNERVFCLSLTNIYGSFKMIHRENYCNMKERGVTSSKMMDIEYETLKEFFNVTHDSLKYYLDNSIKLLETLGLIKHNKLMYVKLIEAESIHTIFTNIESSVITRHRRATMEEEQYIKNLEASIRTKYNIPNNSKLFGRPVEEIEKLLKNLNIEYYYDRYEIICIDKTNVNKISDFYNLDNLNNISEEFSNNFISMTIANAESRHNNAVMNNLIDFYRFSEKYLKDFMKLSDTTLKPNSEKVFVPNYKFNTIEDGRGGYTMKAEKLN